MNHPLARYSINDFDKYNCLTLSAWYWLALAVLLKGYVVALLSLSNMQDKLAFIRYVYPEPQAFYSSLLTGMPALLLLVIILARRPNAAILIKRLWAKFYLLLSLTMLIDCAMLWLLPDNLLRRQIIEASIQTFVNIGLLVIIGRSDRARYNLSEFPELLDGDPSPAKNVRTNSEKKTSQ